MSETDEPDEALMDKVEKLYSLINRMRFYRDVMLEQEARKLAEHVEKLRKEIMLTPEEVEKLADELDEYYISGTFSHGDMDPVSYWTMVVKDRLAKK